MLEALNEFVDNSGFNFELAQYYARTCEYAKAIEYYEMSWKLEEGQKARYTDALHGISIIYEILEDYEKAAKTYDRIIACLKEEWGYCDEDAAVIQAERERKRLVNKLK